MIWKTLKSDIAYDGSPFFTLLKQTVLDRRGQTIEPWYQMQAANFVVVVPVTEDGNLVMVQQYRHGLGDMSIELPSGKLNDNESPQDAAERELLEETGFKCTTLQKIGKQISSDTSFSTSKFDIYIGLGCTKIAEQKLDATEDITVVIKPFDEALKLALSGEICSTASIVALLWAAFYSGLLGL